MIISIGADCGMADFCKKYNLRNMSLPFDWVGSCQGVSKCIDEDFTDFIPELGNTINKYEIHFHHNFIDRDKYDEDKARFLRRIERFQNILQTSKDEIIFCRKGHGTHNHHDHTGKYSDLKNDIDDAEELDRILSTRYPNLNYKIIVMLLCARCFDPATIYESKSTRIAIYNVASVVTRDADMNYETCAKKIFLHQ